MKRLCCSGSAATTAILAIALTLLSGCGGSDKKNNPLGTDSDDLVGIWDLVDVMSQWDGHTYHAPQEEIDDDPMTYRFRANHTVVYEYQGYEMEFEWETEGKTLSFYYDSDFVGSCTFGVNSTTLTMSFYEEEYYITHTFKKR